TVYGFQFGFLQWLRPCSDERAHERVFLRGEQCSWLTVDDCGIIWTCQRDGTCTRLHIDERSLPCREEHGVGLEQFCGSAHSAARLPRRPLAEGADEVHGIQPS